MANMIDYLDWRGDLSFKADSLNPVDNLVFARLSYIDFSDALSGGETLKSLATRYLPSEEKVTPGVLLNEGTKELLEAAGLSKRFGSVILKNYESKLDLDRELQFSAMTFEIDDKTAYVVFRGTDDTLVGWKEDFNMSFMDVVPAQKEASRYLNGVLKKHNYKTVYVGGHSKGGNLAIYSAVHLNRKFKSRLIQVFNNDGPGFKQSIIDREEYQDVADRIVTLIPQSSIVGLLLESGNNYKVVQSTVKGIMQHEGLSWEVMGKDFVYLPKLRRDAVIIDRTTKGMLEKMSMEQREAFSTVLFDLITVNDSKTLTDIDKGGLGSFFKMSENFRRLDRETKKVIIETLSLFFDEGYKSFIQVTELNQWQGKFKKWREEVKGEIEGFWNKF
ncbi:MAG: DUF2974 domain-containing protein [Spirochaetales bacterium]|nr:DUF2974 domain-containing protein [Spirochaetales bacterium]